MYDRHYHQSRGAAPSLGVLCAVAAIVVALTAVVTWAVVRDTSPSIPAAYGERGSCYYLPGDPGEVVALQHAGLCAENWTPVVMPDYWLGAYWPYYIGPTFRPYLTVPAVVPTLRSTWYPSHRTYVSHPTINRTYVKQTKVVNNIKVINNNQRRSQSVTQPRTASGQTKATQNRPPKTQTGLGPNGSGRTGAAPPKVSTYNAPKTSTFTGTRGR